MWVGNGHQATNPLKPHHSMTVHPQNCDHRGTFDIYGIALRKKLHTLHPYRYYFQKLFYGLKHMSLNQIIIFN